MKGQPAFRMQARRPTFAAPRDERDALIGHSLLEIVKAQIVVTFGPCASRLKALGLRSAGMEANGFYVAARQSR
jgi:hypothetical protein